MIFGINTTHDIKKLSQIFTCLTAREFTCNNFEISLVVFMPNITTNRAITYIYDKEQLPTVVKITHNYTSLTSLILFVFRATSNNNRTFLSPAYRFAFLGTCFSVTHRSKTITIFIYIFLISLSRTLDCRFFKRPKNLWNRPANACCWKRVYGEHLRCGKFTPQAQDYLNHKFDL